MSANSISERVVKVLGSMVRVRVASIHNVAMFAAAERWLRAAFALTHT